MKSREEQSFFFLLTALNLGGLLCAPWLWLNGNSTFEALAQLSLHAVGLWACYRLLRKET